MVIKNKREFSLNIIMRVLVISFCLVYIAFASLEEERKQWINFKSKHGRLYKSLQEEQSRFVIFQRNLRAIEAHNRQYEAGKTTYTKTINQFADLTKKEFVSTLKHRSAGRTIVQRKSIYKKPIGAEVPESIDWRDKGAVSEVKDQGLCGSCWAFSVTGTLEGFNYLKTNKMVTFSEQQLVDCSTENSGCGGGEEGPALEYVKTHGIETEDSYPYDEDDMTCRYNESAVFLRIKDYVQIEANNEDELLSAVGLLGPISVALDADGLNFYEGGIFTDEDCSKDFTDHAVLAVGYGKDKKTGLDYWIVKNSWGADWGENGYFRIKRGDNECAIALDCVYPVLY